MKRPSRPTWLDIRTFVPPGPAWGWILKSILLVALVVAGVSIALRSFGVEWPTDDVLVAVTVMSCLAGFAVGLAARSDKNLGRRLARTHVEVPMARTPMVWAWAAVLAAAVSGAVAPFVMEPSSLGRATVACGAAALATVVLAATGRVLRVQLAVESVPVAGPPAVTSRPYVGDQPIGTTEEDTLGRGPVIAALIEAIERLSGPSPAFVSLEGPWGSGKSSIVALTRRRLESDGRLTGTFSGFHFAARERLAESFLAALGKTLGERYATADVRGALLRLWESTRPIADRAMPVGLPAAQTSPSDANAYVRSFIESIPRPVVVFVEDVDRLTGSDILTLISAITSAGDLPGFIFVLVMDRSQVEIELQRVVANGPEYLRKVTNASIRVPPPPPEVLLQVLDRFLDGVLEARKVVIAPNAFASLPREVWTTLVPTVRHAKHLANAYSAALAQIGGEVNAADVLLLTVLEEFAPTTLHAIQTRPSLWMEGLGPESLLDALRHHRASPQEHEAGRSSAIDASQPDESRRSVVREIVDLVFPEGGDAMTQLREQRVVQHEYFRRFIERRVAPGGVSDHAIKALIESVNAASEADVPSLVGAFLAGYPTYAALDRMAVLAEAIEPPKRRAVVIGVARYSRALPSDDSWFQHSERERARAVVYRLLELDRGDEDTQRATMLAAIREATSLEFARELVVLAAKDRNRVLTKFSAFDQSVLRTELSAEIHSRLADGLDPFESEPRDAPFILAAVGDPHSAAEHAVRLNRVPAVLRGYQRSERLSQGGTRLNLESLCREFDVEVLRAAAQPGDPLCDELIAAAAPCGGESPEADHTS